MDFVKSELAENRFINQEDLNLFHIVKTVDAALEYIEDFYKVYHSIRYVLGLAVLRLNREISEKTLSFINKEFKDILSSGQIRVSGPTDKEIQEKEFLDLPRLVMNFNMRSYGRLCELIHVINRD
jgi:hypothetical protein